MIRGAFQVIPSTDSQKTAVKIAAFAEVVYVASNCGKGLAYADQLSHVYSAEFSIGLIIGSNQGRSLIVSHMSCTGMACSCSQLATTFLFDDEVSEIEFEESCKRIEEFTRQNTKFPILIVLISDSHIRAISRYAENTTCYRNLPAGSYCFK